MTTYLQDGVEFSQGGREFVAVVDRESHYAGFTCKRCGADFTGDASDHECHPVCTECGATLTYVDDGMSVPGWYDDDRHDLGSPGNTCPVAGEHEVDAA